MKSEYDVLIIGSGASGGMAAYTLTKQGVRCLMLDAGPAVDFDRHRALKPVYDLPYRGFGRPGRFPHVTQASEFDANLWADEKENPYTYPDGDPYYWVRIRLIGGKTLRWGRASWRMSDLEFKCQDHDGFGENWPISYADLAPYYDRVEPIFRVAGRRDGLPQIPDGVFLEDNSPDSLSVQRFNASADKLGVPTIKSRRATGTLASSANLLLPDALATGKLTIVPNAIAREITVDPKTGLVDGVSFVDRQSKREFHAGGARAGSGRVHFGEHAAAAEFLVDGLAGRPGEFERRAGPLPVRPVLREELHPVDRARGARRKGAAQPDGRWRVHPAFSEFEARREEVSARLRVRFLERRHARREILPAVRRSAVQGIGGRRQHRLQHDHHGDRAAAL